MEGRCLRLGDFSAAQAGSADADAPGCAVHFGVNRAQIDVPAALGHIVGVADVIPKLRAFPADFANLWHHELLNIPQKSDFTGQQGSCQPR